MSIPKPLKPLLKKKRFWTDYLWATEPDVDDDDNPAYPQLKDCRVVLPVADGYELHLVLEADLFYFSLEFAAPGREPIQIAWDDQAHWHPHALRWPELETIGDAIAIQDPQLPHPGYLVPLLQRFTPLCVNDDLEVVVATLETAWKELGLFTQSEIAAWIEGIDCREAGFVWRQHEGLGWCLEQQNLEDGGLYTLRCAQNEEFPFAEWGAMIEAAEQVAAKKKRVRKRVKPTLLPRKSHSLRLTIYHEDKQRPLPDSAFAKFFGDTVSAFLECLNIGGMGLSSYRERSNDDGSSTREETYYSLGIQGELDRGLQVLRDALWWSSAPRSTKLWTDATGDKRVGIPLKLNKAPSHPGPLMLEVAHLNVEHFSFCDGYRIDHKPFRKRTRDAFREILAQAGATGPNEDHWFQVAIPDGGQLRIWAPKLDAKRGPDGSVIVVDCRTPGAVELIYRIMSEGELMLLPPAIATSERVAAQIDAPWPKVTIVASAAELHEILARGPYAWWSEGPSDS